MKTYLVLPLAALLALGAGCSGQKSDEADMAQAQDLSAPPDLTAQPDLKQLACGDIAACFLTCLTSGKSTCQDDCTANASSDGKTKFTSLALCLFISCPSSGANAACADPKAPACLACATKALAAGGACRTQAQACGLP